MIADVSYSLPDPIAKFLIKMVEIAERNQVLTVSYATQSGKQVSALDWIIKVGADKETLQDFKGDPMASLEALGLVKRLGKNSVFLYPTAFDRAGYERKGRFGKWWVRTTEEYRDILLTVTTALNIGLWVAQIAQIVYLFMWVYTK
jgi:hypothetical protein